MAGERVARSELARTGVGRANRVTPGGTVVSCALNNFGVQGTSSLEVVRRSRMAMYDWDRYRRLNPLIVRPGRVQNTVGRGAPSSDAMNMKLFSSKR